jgi:hypothetical protein
MVARGPHYGACVIAKRLVFLIKALSFELFGNNIMRPERRRPRSPRPDDLGVRGGGELEPSNRRSIRGQNAVRRRTLPTELRAVEEARSRPALAARVRAERTAAASYS